MTGGACVANGTGTGCGVTLPILLTQPTILALKLWPQTQWTCERDTFHEICTVFRPRASTICFSVAVKCQSYTVEQIPYIHLGFDKSDMCLSALKWKA